MGPFLPRQEYMHQWRNEALNIWKMLIILTLRKSFGNLIELHKTTCSFEFLAYGRRLNNKAQDHGFRPLFHMFSTQDTITFPLKEWLYNLAFCNQGATIQEHAKFMLWRLYNFTFQNPRVPKDMPSYVFP